MKISPDCRFRNLDSSVPVFWQGNAIVWTNLLRHYLLCLMQATSITMVAGKDFTPDLCSRLVHQTEHDLPEAPIRAIYATICDDFLSHDAQSRSSS
jgi:hypothetical protein